MRVGVNNAPKSNITDRRHFLKEAFATLLISGATAAKGFGQDSKTDSSLISNEIIKNARCGSVRLHCKLGEVEAVGSGVLIRDSEKKSVSLLTARHVVTNRRENLGTIIRHHELLTAGKELPQINDRAAVYLHCNALGDTPDFEAVPRKLSLEPDSLNRLLPEMHYCFSALDDTALLDVNIDLHRQNSLVTLDFRNLKVSPLQKNEPVFFVGNSGEKPFATHTGTVIDPLHFDAQVNLGLPLIKIKIEVDAGDSGAALLDSKGRIVGVLIKEHIEDPFVGYAVPSSSFLGRLRERWDFNPVFSD